MSHNAAMSLSEMLNPASELTVVNQESEMPEQLAIEPTLIRSGMLISDMLNPDNTQVGLPDTPLTDVAMECDEDPMDVDGEPPAFYFIMV
jgi:hypothetical protein